MKLDYGSFVTVKRTAKAVLIQTNGRQAWLPKAQTRYVVGGIEVPDWLASRAGLTGPTPSAGHLRKVANLRANGSADYEGDAAREVW